MYSLSLICVFGKKNHQKVTLPQKYGENSFCFLAKDLPKLLTSFNFFLGGVCHHRAAYGDSFNGPLLHNLTSDSRRS